MDANSANTILSRSGSLATFRIAYAIIAFAILSVPLIAMQLSADGVDWTAFDFAFAGGMLLALGLEIELVLRFVSGRWLRATVIGLGLALFVFVWGALATA